MDVQQLTQSDGIVGGKVVVLSDETDGEFRRVMPAASVETGSLDGGASEVAGGWWRKRAQFLIAATSMSGLRIQPEKNPIESDQSLAVSSTFWYQIDQQNLPYTIGAFVERSNVLITRNIAN